MHLNMSIDSLQECRAANATRIRLMKCTDLLMNAGHRPKTSSTWRWPNLLGIYSPVILVIADIVAVLPVELHCRCC